MCLQGYLAYEKDTDDAIVIVLAAGCATTCARRRGLRYMNWPLLRISTAYLQWPNEQQWEKADHTAVLASSSS